MRASRLLSLLLLLQMRQRLTAEALAAEFEVSVRTIYRDIEALSAAGVPVYGERGPSGGFQLLEGYRTQLTGLAQAEAEAVFMIGLPDAASSLGLGSAAANASRKLLAALSPSLREGAGRLSERFHLDAVEWYQAAEPLAHLPSIARAVLDERVVTMTYESWKETREWRVEPLGLVLKAGTWYLVAHTAVGPRTFKVSNIHTHTVEKTTFARPTDFSLPAYWAEQLERFEKNLRPATAVLRATAVGRVRLGRLGAYAALAVKEAAPPDEAGWVRVHFPFENIEQAALALLSLGPEVEVLEPLTLRERLRALAEAIARRASPVELA